MSEIVKYHNDMNKVALNGFNEKELNILFSLIVLSRDKGTSELAIPFSELRTLSNDDGKNRDRFINSMINVNSKLIQLFYKIETKDSITMFTLFNQFHLDLKEDILFVQINKKFAYILNDLVGNFTKFELVDFVKLKSSYSKNMFKLLKQWESKKEKEFTLEELRYLLSVPQSYNNSKFNEKVLKPIREELSKLLPNFYIEKIKSKKAVVGYKFSWKPKYQNINYNDDVVEIQISEELQKAFEKVSHNRYIQPFMTNNNKAELIELFENEKILIKGLYFAYKKIDKEFKRLSYLIKVISTGITQEKKVIKVTEKSMEDITIEDIQNNNVRQITFDEVLAEKKEKQVEKIDINEDEFENLYQKYLKDNNIEDNFYAKKAFSIRYNIIKKEEKKMYTIDDIPAEKLIGKNGKKLIGGALQARVKKILKEMNENL